MNCKSIAIASLVLIFVISAVSIKSAYASTYASDIRVSMMGYTPYPAEPGNYVTLTLKVENIGGSDADNVRLKISPQYPFYLDNGSTVTVQNSATPISLSSDTTVSLGKLPASKYAIVEYKIRIDSNALEGDKQLEIWHQTIANDIWAIDAFDILVQGSDMLEVSNVIPSILSPGKPTDVVFVLNNSGTASIRNLAFTWAEKDNKILPLGSGNRKYVESIGSHESAEIPFTLVADPSATSGAYTLVANMTYTIGSNISKSFAVNIGMFVGGNADFDVSLQDSSQAGSVSLSVANVGSNPATSVSMRIPDQEGYSVTGVSSSFLGDLNPGDFTVATFQITQRMGNVTSGQGPQGFNRNATSLSAQGPLKVEIVYTDVNGNRQTVDKDVSIRMQNSTFVGTGAQFGQRQRSSGLDLIIFGAAGVVIVVVLIKYNGRIRNALKKRKKSHGGAGEDA